MEAIIAIRSQFAAARASYPVEWIQKRDTFGAVRALRQGKLLVVMVDLNTTRGGLEADFLGLPACSPTGPARLARRLRVPVVPAVSVRVAPGRATLSLLPPLRHLAGPESDPSFTAELYRRFEPWVVEYAEQYNWLHPRWRHRPDGSVWSTKQAFAEQASRRTRPFLDLPPRVRALLAEPTR